MSRILYVINPVAFAGLGKDVWKRFCALWPDSIDKKDIALTQKCGQAREIAASYEGYDIIAAVGGDGTANEVLSGIMDRPGPKPALALIPAGTGNDIAYNAGVCSVEDAVSALRAERRRRYDLIRVDCSVGGKPAHRYSFIFCGVGFAAGLLGTLKPWMRRVFGPKGAYFFAAILSALSYRPTQMSVRWGDGEHSGRTWVAIIGNSQVAGGQGMRICPGALTDDGELNVVIIPAQSKLKILLQLAKTADGSYVQEKGVLYFKAKRVEVGSSPQAAIGIDGDVFGTTPAKITVCPRAIEILSL